MRLIIPIRTALLASFGVSALAATAAYAQQPPPCAKGVELRLSSASALQGGLLRVEVQTAAPLAELKAEWSGHPLPFWQDAADKNIQHALLGIDLEHPVGRYHLTLTAELAHGQPVKCAALVSVKAGKFTVERLRVAQKFVEPGPEEIARANKERDHLRAIFATMTSERFWQGSFHRPLDDAKSAGNFGRQRILNGEPGSPHGGEDFPAVAGTPVHAPQRGRVALAEELYFSGNTVVLDHGLGLYTFYGHLSAINVTVGQIVEPGTVLGLVGATGRVTGPHLHWGVTLNQARVNPLDLASLPPE
ncbi:MAG TPA: M23 family metallopeptidase [Candidatus Acidoferrales bacterium]|nr:M23 family metallopeptidase [Candidatus Acidoferrales bacterium]